ncbi:hypothetical protein M4951_08435 [Blastopirellula sp. J2-11]|uniref:hypothetical protein n=1 Tax=Blastopirellula sp. J2-11 TaxID=2943192 RepID=UPI0021C6DB5E|nr:hypothetical protein [Blastopirellula sp. J2-11]UUO08329.1 hypothetical protein M4951_08435 [Blastopirellula sp. J2-11]
MQYSPLKPANLCLLFCFTAAFIGCEEQPRSELTISGNVTLNGSPIPSGTITFVDKHGEAQTGGGVIKNGRYTAFVQPGEKSVLVLGNEPAGMEPELSGVPDSDLRPAYRKITPDAYSAVQTTELSANVIEPTQDLDFDLVGQRPVK